ncbi:MAG: hypothetical protein COU27_02440 [Candidatus Levybacteria bacterium CG10_big_fil_rev_8_21_14_0_10_36_7]|nr:MAG: hypothetical protein COU27_02440 [Candidatus Levybacteria bacterium CG10_big_fil_rev_8_21_14_0_10_36_7]
MFATTFIAVVGVVFTVSSYISAGVNTVNLVYDQSVVSDSLTQMDETAKQLKEKALAEPDPTLRQQKLLVAQKLSETQSQLSEHQSKILINGARKEALALSKSIVAGSLPDAIGLTDSIADQNVGFKGVHNSKVSDVTIWSKLARSSESLDVEIAKIKTRQTLEDLSGVNDELAVMVRSFQEQEKQGQLDSDKFEEKIGELIESKTELNDHVLAGLDVDTDFANKQENTETEDKVIKQEETLSPIETQPGKTIYGDWVLFSTEENGTNLDKYQKDNIYRLTEDGKYIFMDYMWSLKNVHYLYKLDNNRGTVLKVVHISASYTGEDLPELVKYYQEKFQEFSFEYSPEKDQIIFPKTGAVLTRKPAEL